MTVTSADIRHIAPRSGFGRIVLAEWTKFRTVRSSCWTLVIAIAVTISAGILFLQAEIDDYSGPPGQAASYAVQEGWWFHWVYSWPPRTRVLAAKVVSLAAVLLVAGAVQTVAALLIARPILAERSIDIPLSDPTVWRGVVMATLTVVGGLFGLGAGLVVRHTAGAIGAVVAVTWVVSALVNLLPASWENVVKALPASAMWAMNTPGAGTLSGGSAAAVFFGYVAALLTIAGVLFARRDA